MKKHTAVTKAPDTRMMLELGQTGLERLGGRIYEEFLRQLSGTLALKAYREMSENDATVGAMFYALEGLIRGVTWNVEPGGQERSDEEAADFVKTLPDDMSHGWKSFISEWMATPTYGFGPFEIVWKRREGWNREPGQASRHNDGRIGIRKLAVRHPATLDHWKFDDAGGMQGMIQRCAPTYKLIEIPIEKLLLFTVGQRKGNPEGTSLLRRAYTSHQRKKGIEGIEAVGIERDLAGLPMAWVPPSWLDADASASDAASLAEIKKIVRNVRRDEQEGMVVPMVYDPDGRKLFDFTLLTTGGRRNFDTSAVIERYDRRIAMTILADVILVGHEKVGSFALASSKTHLFAVGVGALLDGIEEVLNRHLIPRVLELNGFPLENMPRFTHGDIESVDLAELGAYVTSLAGAGMPLFPTEDGALERELLRAANLPNENLAVDALLDEITPPEGEG